MKLFVLAVLTLALGACTFTYPPLVPESRLPESVLDLGSPSTLSQEAARLKLMLTLHEVPEADWLAVQWFAPNNDEVASASTWVTPEDVGGTRDLFLPERVELRPGTWRAVVSYQGRVVRQFSAAVEAVAEGENGLEN